MIWCPPLISPRRPGLRRPGLGWQAISHRPDFDRTYTRKRTASGDGDRLVEVVDVDQHVAAEVLARLRERAIGEQPLAVTHADAGRRRRGMHRVAAEILPLRRQLVRDLH